MVLDEKAQISVELIIVLAAVVAIVLILVSRLQSTAEEGTKLINRKTEDIFDEIRDIK